MSTPIVRSFNGPLGPAKVCIENNESEPLSGEAATVKTVSSFKDNFVRLFFLWGPRLAALAVLLTCVVVVGLLIAGVLHTGQGVLRALGAIGTETGDMVTDVAHGIGNEARIMASHAHKDFDKLARPVLSFTDMLADHTGGMISKFANVTDAVAGTGEAVAATGVDLTTWAAWQIKYAAWVMSCVITAPEVCKADFYHKFNLCGHLEKLVKIDGRMISMHAPCEETKHRIVWDREAVAWEENKFAKAHHHVLAVMHSDTPTLELVEQAAADTDYAVLNTAMHSDGNRCVQWKSDRKFCTVTHCLTADGSKSLDGSDLAVCLAFNNKVQLLSQGPHALPNEYLSFSKIRVVLDAGRERQQILNSGRERDIPPHPIDHELEREYRSADYEDACPVDDFSFYWRGPTIWDEGYAALASPTTATRKRRGAEGKALFDVARGAARRSMTGREQQGQLTSASTGAGYSAGGAEGRASLLFALATATFLAGYDRLEDVL